MRTRTIVALAVTLAVGIAALVAFRAYKLRLIHVIVENAVIQKAPDHYPRDRIAAAFDNHLAEAERRDREDVYMDRLLSASQRLEKIQRLENEEMDRLLAELDPSGSGAAP